MNRNYKRLCDLQITLAELTEWADGRKTAEPVALAVHALAASDRTPDQIWDDPTQAELDHVAMAVQEYISHGDYPASADGRYQWGLESIQVDA